LNLPFFISRRISKPDEDTFSGTINKVAIVSIALGLAVMIIAFFILLGFKGTIRDKIFSFNGHLLVSKYTMGSSYQEDPISTNYPIYQDPGSFEYVEHIQEFSNKAGLIKTSEEVDGVIFKGIGPSFSLDHFAGNMKSGKFVDFKEDGYSTDVVLSQKIADRLKLDTGDLFIMHFIQNPPRSRRLSVAGIYETGLEDFDERVILGDINLIRRLNNWADTLAGGFEVFLKDIDQLDEAYQEMYYEVDSDLFVQKVSDRYVQIFDWLHLINNNVTIFLVLILFVASFNMVSIVLILIMERTQMIGLLKAVGAKNNMIRKIFRYQGMQLIVKGLALGNLVGLGLCFLQYQFHLIKLDQDSYYMSYVPIEWNWTVVVLLNLLIFGVVYLVMILPTTAISRMSPIKSIRFD
jgi:lipoprotein-releasing system permease protein